MADLNPAQLSPQARDRITGRMQAFLVGELVLSDLYELTREELYAVAQQGKTLYDSGDLESARKVFEGLSALDPYDAWFHTGLGAVYQQQGRLEDAVIEYDRAVSLNERDIAARCNRAEILLQLGRLGQAVEDLQSIATLDPECQDLHSQRARAMTVALHTMAQQAGSP
jgi:Flp pilus assembly protein TadD